MENVYTINQFDIDAEDFFQTYLQPQQEDKSKEISIALKEIEAYCNQTLAV